MRALTLTGLGSLDALQVQDVPPPPPPGPDQVLLKVRTVALNRLDLFVVDGLPGITLKFPHVVCSDAAGLVEAMGSGVAGLEPGQRVMVNPGISCYACEYCLRGDHSLCRSYGMLGEHLPGAAAELLLVPARNVAPVPSGMPWDQAAAFSLATLTAWRMLIHRAALRAGETVVIWGIGGGVALAALQVAKLAGARVIVTSSSDAKLAAAAELGADFGLNHATTNVPQEVRRITGGRGAEIVVDNVGEKTWTDSLRCLGRAGRLVTCGATSGPMCVTDVRKLFWYQWSILGSTMGGYQEYQEIVRQAAMGKLWPRVDRVFPLTEGRAAFEHLRQGAQLGKIVIEVSRD